MIFAFIPFLLVQPTFIFWAFYKLITFINKQLLAKNETIFRDEVWFVILVVTAVIAPLIGFSIDATANENQSTESWGNDTFRLFALPYVKDMAIFYFTTIGLVGFCIHFFKNQLHAALFNNGLLVTLIALSIISTFQLGPVGFLMGFIPIVGLLFIAPLFNVLLFTSVFIYHIKNSAAKQINTETNLVIAIGIALAYIILFQLSLSFCGFDKLGLIKAFTENPKGFLHNN
jgi:hypothetical protein